jgi:hypothetical protein
MGITRGCDWLVQNSAAARERGVRNAIALPQVGRYVGRHIWGALRHWPLISLVFGSSCNRWFEFACYRCLVFIFGISDEIENSDQALQQPPKVQCKESGVGYQSAQCHVVALVSVYKIVYINVYYIQNERFLRSPQTAAKALHRLLTISSAKIRRSIAPCDG